MRIQIDQATISKLAANTRQETSSDQKKVSKKSLESVVLDENFGKLLQIAQEPSDLTDRVQKARLDLKNGQLDTDEAIQSAAENILNFGV